MPVALLVTGYVMALRFTPVLELEWKVKVRQYSGMTKGPCCTCRPSQIFFVKDSTRLACSLWVHIKVPRKSGMFVHLYWL